MYRKGEEREVLRVFPSEVVADHRRIEAVRSAGRGAVRADRYMSWDSFKERVFRRYRSEEPANRAVRTLFVQDFLMRNAGVGFLRAIVPERAASSSMRFARYVRSALPGLPALRGGDARAAMPPGLRSDVDRLLAEYEAFLERRGLFEPAWETPAPPDELPATVVFFPDTIADFEELGHVVARHPRVELFSTTGLAPSAGAGQVREYEHSLSEVRALFRELEELLETGVPAEEVAVTVGDLESIRHLLEEEAYRRQVPLSMRSGRPLVESSGGRLFRLLSEWISQGLSADALKLLMLNSAIPWLEPRRGTLLVRLGLEYGCVGGGRAEWEYAFRRAERDTRSGRGGKPVLELLRREGMAPEDSARFFRRFLDAATAVTQAGSLSELRKAVLAFLARFVDGESWSHHARNVLQRSVLVLRDLADAEAAGGLASPAPLSLFLEALTEEIYVPRGGTGIPLYPYRVSAGIRPRYHFVINAAREHIRVRVPGPPFLRDDHRAAAGLDDREQTDAFFRLYRASGSRVRISYATRTPVGARIAPPLRRVPVDPPSDSAYRRDAFTLERSFWAGEGELPNKLYGTQSDGLAQASRDLLRIRGDDVRAGTPLAADLVARVVPRTDSEQDSAGGGVLPVRLSPSSYERARNTPFGYLLRLAAGDELVTAARVSDVRALGTVYHALLARIFETKLAAMAPPASVGSSHFEEEVKQLVERYFDSACERTMLAPAVAAMYRERVGERIAVAFRRTVERLGAEGLRIEAVEENLEAAIAEGRVVLSGRVDAVFGNAEGTRMLVDFKRSDGTLPARRDAVDELRRPQLLLYVLMAETAETPVDAAYYVTIEGQRDVEVFGPRKGWVKPEEWPALSTRLAREVTATADRIVAGNFECPDPYHSCEGCTTRSACRGGFVVRRP